MEKQTHVADEQLVGLELAGELYGVEISRIQEIIRMQPITAVPKSPPFVVGLTSLRSRVIPVMDLRARFGLETFEPTRRSRIVVVEMSDHTVGLIVDAVSEVLRISAASVEPPSSLVTIADSAYLRGVAKIDERLVLLLDLPRVLSTGEIAALAA
jgi:purine-binding chemotaxis protein CheW